MHSKDHEIGINKGKKKVNIEAFKKKAKNFTEDLGDFIAQVNKTKGKYQELNIQKEKMAKEKRKGTTKKNEMETATRK